MKILELKQNLSAVEGINFRLPDGSYLPSHFHVTEVGLVNKHFIDCGGVERTESVANFQLWVANDYDHKLAPQKFLHILNLSQKVLGNNDLPIEVKYQQSTIGKFGLDFDGKDFLLTPKQTACLAEDACGISNKPAEPTQSCCPPSSGCC